MFCNVVVTVSYDLVDALLSLLLIEPAEVAVVGSVFGWCEVASVVWP